MSQIPERRPPIADKEPVDTGRKPAAGDGEISVWRCRVCGYLCARRGPPETCPICKVPGERFEPFSFA